MQVTACSMEYGGGIVSSQIIPAILLRIIQHQSTHIFPVRIGVGQKQFPIRRKRTVSVSGQPVHGKDLRIVIPDCVDPELIAALIRDPGIDDQMFRVDPGVMGSMVIHGKGPQIAAVSVSGKHSCHIKASAAASGFKGTEPVDEGDLLPVRGKSR